MTWKRRARKEVYEKEGKTWKGIERRGVILIKPHVIREKEKKSRKQKSKKGIFYCEK